MDGIKVSTEEVISMDAIAPGLFGLRIAFVNVFGVEHPGGTWTLIDAGLPGSAPVIAHWAEKRFGKPPACMVLTHGHFDHVGAAQALAERWDIPVYAHPLEFPYVTGERAYPPPDVSAGGGLMTLLSPLYPKDPIDLGARLRALPPSVPGELTDVVAMPGWQLLATPGHTPGHVSLFRPEDRTLLVGDAFCSTKPESFFEAALVQQPELHGPPAYFTSDWGAAQQSVKQLAALLPRTVAPGHGKPLSGPDVAQQLQELATRFTETALPKHKREDHS